MFATNWCAKLCGVAAVAVAVAWGSVGSAKPAVGGFIQVGPVTIGKGPIGYPYPYPYPNHHQVYRPLVVVSNPAVNPLPAAVAVTIVNPAESGATLAFRLGGSQYSLAPGSQTDLTLTGAKVIEFDRGGSFGTARFMLYGGVYKFAMTDQGWTLQQQK